MIPGLWAGVLLCIALIATPAPFAVLAPHEAGRVVTRIFANEAYLSLGLAVLLLLLERRQAQSDGMNGLNRPMLLALGTLFCTVAGYFALQPMMAEARAGSGRLSFGQLHAISLGLYGLKTLLVLALGWRAAQAGRPTSSVL